VGRTPDVSASGKIPARRKQLIVLIVVAVWLSFLLSIASKDFGRKAYQLPIEDSVKVEVTLDFSYSLYQRSCLEAFCFGGLAGKSATKGRSHPNWTAQLSFGYRAVPDR
jgi:hypothetical protein